MTLNWRKKAFIINTASFERVLYALNVAVTAATLGDEVYILFAYGGLLRLKKGLEDSVGEETDEWVRSEIRGKVEKGTIPRISELIKLLRSLGGKVYACPTAMGFHNLTRNMLLDEIDDVRGLSAFLSSDAKDAIIIYV